MSKKIDPRLASVGARIAEARRAKGLRQEDVAGHLGVTTGAVGQWERGYVMPTMANFDQLAVFLGASREYLLTGEEREGAGKAADEIELEILRLSRRLDIVQRAQILVSMAELAGAEIEIANPKRKK